MKITALIDFFIHPEYFNNNGRLRRARLFVRASLLTSLFSSSYVWLSVLFDFDRGVSLMIFNVVGFLLLPFLAKTKLPIAWLGNLYVAIGAFAIVVLTYYSGGVWSAIYPWIISIPILALLVVNKISGSVWGVISFLLMLWFGVLAIQGVELPIEYNPELKTIWFVSVVPGLLLIILFIAFVFEYTQSKTLNELEKGNEVLKEQKETIALQSSEYKKLVEEKDYIIRILAHDLKNPLSNISGLVKLLETDPARLNEYTDMIKQSTSKAQHLLSRVMEMDVSDPQNIDLQLEPIDLEFVLKEVLEFISEPAKEKQIGVTLTNDASKSIIMADKTYVSLVFENLVFNAIKFSEKDTQVRVIITNNNTSVQVKIIDQGLGISPDEENELFKKFSKLSTRPTAGESSTGLGLFLVKRHVGLIGGKVWFDTNSDKGSTFIVELPLAN